MSFKCKLGLHAWDGCTCIRCAKKRDGQHKWNGNQCSECGQEILSRNNVGTRLLSIEHAEGNWFGTYIANYTGSVIFGFSTPAKAREALSQLSYIHVAADTGELISTEVIEYGYFNRGEKGEVAIWGFSFTDEMYNEAIEKLTKAGGTLVTSQKPRVTGKQETDPGNIRNSGIVKFVKEEHMGKNTYKIYSGPSKASAMEFLQKTPVQESFYYIIVETPEGNYGRDINGIYREDKG